jgi:CrcB protein
VRIALGVALLGALGSLFRWLLSAAIQRQVGSAFPAGTFVVNALGSIAIGVVMGFFLTRESGTETSALTSGVAIALTAGFMGGFTTYSSFAFETVLLIERRSFAAAALNVGGTLIVCLFGCAVGLLAGRFAGR